VIWLALGSPFSGNRQPSKAGDDSLTESFLKEALDEVFPRPSIREVAFEIRFAPRLRISAELWKIQDAVVDQYPIVGSEQALQPNGTILMVNVFQNPTAARAIKVSQENFVVAFTKYTRFEDFKEEVIAKTKQFCSKFDVSSIARAGLRYVNNIVIPAADKTSTILRYVRPVIDFERVDIEDIDQFVTEVRMRRKNHLVTLRGALLGTLEDGRRVYVLDVDCHSRVQQKAEEIPELLDEYHESAQQFFLDHITDQYKDVMRGKS
jgi:uncharacterized protein (TIGR04255 family)